MQDGLYIGTAGWTVPKESRHRFPDEGTHLQRYAAHFNAAEINSSFYRPHRPSTYARWADSVPENFRFSLKLPKEITHKKRLVDTDRELDAFLVEATSLGRKLGPILIQLPPSFAYDDAVVGRFIDAFRVRFPGAVVLEPRHATWFEPQVQAVLESAKIARVAADPPPVVTADLPAGWNSLRYFRVHGSPRIYYSPYDDAFLERLAFLLGQVKTEQWCIFDNTALGYAATDALRLMEILGKRDQET